METRKVFALRNSTRDYQQKQVSEEDLMAILTAGCAAPVGMGRYDALHITVVQGKKQLEQLSSAASKVMGQSNPFYGAPTVILISSQKDLDPGIAAVNAACMMENMLLAGADFGVGSVIVWSTAIAVRMSPDLQNVLGIPDGYEATLSAAYGYPAKAVTVEKELSMRFTLNRV